MSASDAAVPADDPPLEPEARARWNVQFDVMSGPLVVSYLLEQLDALRPIEQRAREEWETDAKAASAAMDLAREQRDTYAAREKHALHVRDCALELNSASSRQLAAVRALADEWERQIGAARNLRLSWLAPDVWWHPSDQLFIHAEIPVNRLGGEVAPDGAVLLAPPYDVAASPAAVADLLAVLSGPAEAPAPVVDDAWLAKARAPEPMPAVEAAEFMAAVASARGPAEAAEPTPARHDLARLRLLELLNALDMPRVRDWDDALNKVRRLMARVAEAAEPAPRISAAHAEACRIIREAWEALPPSVRRIVVQDGATLAGCIRAIPTAGSVTTTPDPAAPDEDIARLFHDAYERLAPAFGYRTREESAKPWTDVPGRNRALMVATVHDVRAALAGTATTPQPAEHKARRGDVVEDWIKAARDRQNADGTPWDLGRWNVLDDLLEDYRLHSDTGTPLDRHACDGSCCCSPDKDPA